jgi:hypothetical protein
VDPRLLLVAAALALTACAAPAASPPASGSSSASPSATSPRQVAQQEAARLLSLVPAMPGAVEHAGSVPPLTDPVGVPMVETRVISTRTWLLPSPYASTVAWLEAHPPNGLGVASTATFGSHGAMASGVTYSDDAHASARLGTTWLELSVAQHGTGSEVRADAVVVWLDPVPYRDDRTGPRLRLTVAGGCPAKDTGAVGVRDDAPDLEAALLPDAVPSAAILCRYAGINGTRGSLTKQTRLGAAQAAEVAAYLRSAPLSHVDGAVRSCPMLDGSLEVLAFAYPGRDDVDLWWPVGGCALIANGRIAVDGSGLRGQAPAALARG